MTRALMRKNDQIRKTSLETNVNPYAEGSCLIKMGGTTVLCTASVEDGRPLWMRQQNILGKGWVTAEYSMLPRATQRRMQRDNRQNQRMIELQRVIGRSLRSIIDLRKLGERQIFIDCDVLTAHGGTRCASITGGFVALYQACEKLVNRGKIAENPITDFVSAISAGVFQEEILLDLDYDEDSQCQVDANFVMTEDGRLVEILASGEEKPFEKNQFDVMLEMAQKGTSQLIKLQKQILGV